MWAYSFMQQALIAGLLVASICGMMSVLVVLRKSAFATHALGHTSVTGAALAILLGYSAIGGQLLLNLFCAIAFGLMGDKLKKNDLSVGVVLSFVLGCGIYCLFLLQNHTSGSVMNILFGNILLVTPEQIYLLLALALCVVIVLGVFVRQLIFISLDPTLARAKNLSERLLAMVFFLLLAFTVSMACQIVGALLVFVLLVIPGAIATQWSDGIYQATLLSMLVASITVAVSLMVSFQLNLPTSFCITTLLTLLYFAGSLYHKVAHFMRQ